jgi:hypothetical protein
MNRWVRNVSVVGKAAIALMLVFAIVSISTPALCGGHGGGHGGGHSFGHYGNGGYARPAGYHHGYRHGYGYGYRGAYSYRPYGYYYYPVTFYAPSPVVYAPPPAGINLIFPVRIH